MTEAEAVVWIIVMSVFNVGLLRVIAYFLDEK